MGIDFSLMGYAAVGMVPLLPVQAWCRFMDWTESSHALQILRGSPLNTTIYVYRDGSVATVREEPNSVR
jgi:hypothetical protein